MFRSVVVLIILFCTFEEFYFRKTYFILQAITYFSKSNPALNMQESDKKIIIIFICVLLFVCAYHIMIRSFYYINMYNHIKCIHRILYLTARIRLILKYLLLTKNYNNIYKHCNFLTLIV